MYFGIYSQSEIETIKLKGQKTVLVRIFSDTVKEKLQIKNNLYKNIITLYINDLKEDMETPEFVEGLNKCFRRLNDFILENDFDEIIVHCEAGLSRSPAIMICIARILNNSEIEEIIKNNFPIYNKCIVKNFENHNYKIKNTKIENVFFTGHYVNLDEEDKVLIKKLFINW